MTNCYENPLTEKGIHIIDFNCTENITEILTLNFYKMERFFIKVLNSIVKLLPYLILKIPL